MKLNFVAVDFETANNYRASVVQIGIVKVINGQVDEILEGLFRPPADIDFFSPVNVGIHGITHDHVKNEPTFHSSLSEINDFMGNLPIIAHNVGFEKSVFNKTDEYTGIPIRRQYECTLKLARQRYPQLPNHKLLTVAQHMDIEFNKSKHHDAVFDAVMAAKIYSGMKI